MSKTLQINQQNSCSSSLHSKPKAKQQEIQQQLSTKLQIIFGFIYANKGPEIRQITPNINATQLSTVVRIKI
jgi:hypothetical protein